MRRVVGVFFAAVGVTALAIMLFPSVQIFGAAEMESNWGACCGHNAWVSTQSCSNVACDPAKSWTPSWGIDLGDPEDEKIVVDGHCHSDDYPDSCKNFKKRVIKPC